MHWPIEWLWVAVVVAMALLIVVGLVMGQSTPWFSDSTKVSPTNRVETGNTSSGKFVPADREAVATDRYTFDTSRSVSAD
jgi:hypothetical protein